MKAFALALLASAFSHPAFAEALVSRINPAAVPAFKSIESERYLSSFDAHALLVAEPEILFIDVRDPVEISLSGHATVIDAIVPVRVLSAGEDGIPVQDRLAANPDFIASMEMVLRDNNKSRHDLIILTCGSGRRSAEAARILEAHGFTNVWHIPDGYEGDDARGFNTHNAWQLAGLPWTDATAAGGEWRMVFE